jgi:hypothetical protein
LVCPFLVSPSVCCVVLSRSSLAFGAVSVWFGLFFFALAGVVRGLLLFVLFLGGWPVLGWFGLPWWWRGAVFCVWGVVDPCALNRVLTPKAVAPKATKMSAMTPISTTCAPAP